MYLYEMHAHTSEVSACADATSIETVKAYKSLGYAGVCITDHFFNSESINVDLSLPWSEQVDAFCEGYNTAKIVGDEIGIDVFFGWEYRYFYNYNGQRYQDFLTYGLDKEWLISHPSCTSWGFLKYCDEVHKAGGVIVYAHPFRSISDLSEPAFTSLEYIDAIETCNASLNEAERVASFTYAIKNNMPIMGASDNHNAHKSHLFAMDFGSKQKSLKQLLDSILNSRGKIVQI